MKSALYIKACTVWPILEYGLTLIGLSKHESMYNYQLNIIKQGAFKIWFCVQFSRDFEWSLLWITIVIHEKNV